MSKGPAAARTVELTIELPTQTPIVSSILPFIAIQTAVTCSAALAYDKYERRWKHAASRIRTTMGIRIRPMKGFGRPYLSEVSSMEATTTGKVRKCHQHS